MRHKGDVPLIANAFKRGLKRLPYHPLSGFPCTRRSRATGTQPRSAWTRMLPTRRAEYTLRSPQVAVFMDT